MFDTLDDVDRAERIGGVAGGAPRGGTGDGGRDGRGVQSGAEGGARAGAGSGGGSGAERLRELVGKVRPLTLASERAFPLTPALEPLFPSGGLRRGSTVTVTSGAAAPSVGMRGATSLSLALAAAASAAGSWCAAVNLPDLGLVAAAELGVILEHLALVPHVEPRQWALAVGALLDAIDVVLVAPPAHLRTADTRRLTTRARERGALLVAVLGGPRRPGTASPWAEGADVRLVVDRTRWEGPGAGDGRLVARRVEVSVNGRGAAGRGRRVSLWLPAPSGGVTMATDGRTSRNVDSPGASEVAPAPEAAYAGADADRIPDPMVEAPDEALRTAG